MPVSRPKSRLYIRWCRQIQSMSYRIAAMEAIGAEPLTFPQRHTASLVFESTKYLWECFFAKRFWRQGAKLISSVHCLAFQSFVRTDAIFALQSPAANDIHNRTRGHALRRIRAGHTLRNPCGAVICIPG